MKRPYATLLAVRRAEEQQAEIALAEALREVAAVERSLARLREARAAWLDDTPDAAPAAREGVAEAVAALEAAERRAEQRLDDARARAAAARADLLERRRQRKTIERLHESALAADARRATRRTQAELDELGGRAGRLRAGERRP